MYMCVHVCVQICHSTTHFLHLRRISVVEKRRGALSSHVKVPPKRKVWPKDRGAQLPRISSPETQWTAKGSQIHVGALSSQKRKGCRGLRGGDQIHEDVCGALCSHAKVSRRYISIIIKLSGPRTRIPLMQKVLTLCHTYTTACKRARASSLFVALQTSLRPHSRTDEVSMCKIKLQ